MSDLRFEILDGRVEPYAVAPTLAFRLRIEAPGGQRVQSVALRIQVQVEATRRHYSPDEEGRLFELFGAPSRWGETLRTMLWTHVSLNVPSFTGQVDVDLPVGCTYDFEVAASKFFHALDDGVIPLLFQFSGTVFAQGPNGLAADQVSWDREARYRLPVRLWRQMMDAYFPNSAWLRLRRDTFDRLLRYKGRHAVTSWDEAVDRLLDEAGQGAAEPLEGAAADAAPAREVQPA